MRFLKCLFFVWLCFIIALLGVAYNFHLANQKKAFHNISGAYLAGMHARYNRDVFGTLHFLKKVMYADPKNLEVQAQVVIAAAIANDQATIDSMIAAFGNRDNESLLLALARAADNFHFAALHPKRERFYYQQALGFIQKFPNQGLYRLTANLLSAWALVGQSRDLEAFALLENIHKETRFSPFARYHMGLIHFYRRNYLEAQKQFAAIFKEERNDVNALKPLYEQAFLFYALVLKYQNKVATLEKWLKKAGSFYTTERRLRSLDRSLANGDYAQLAVTTISQGVSEALANIVLLFPDKDSFGLFLIYGRLAEFLWPKNGAATYAMAEKLLEFGYDDYALKSFEQVAPYSPYYQDALMQTALYYLETGQNHLALERLKTLQHNDPYDRTGCLVFLRYYLKTQQWEKALNYVYYLRGIEDRLNLASAKEEGWLFYYQIAIIYDHFGQVSKVESLLRRALDEGGDNIRILNYLGRFLLKHNKNLPEALELLLKAHKIEPENSCVLDSLGQGYYKLERYQEAERAFKKALHFCPTNSYANEHLGDVYYKKGLLKDAYFQWNHALTFAKTDAQKHLLMKKLNGK